MVDASRCLDTAPVWFQLSDFVPVKPQLSGSLRADLVVIGGGLAGLATAYYAAKAAPGLSIAVLEATRVGGGATGGCTGIVSPGPKMSLTTLRRKYGDQSARAAFDASHNGVDLLRQIVRAEQIDCDARDEPHTLVALTQRQQQRIATHLAALSELGRETRWLTSAELTERAGPGYIAGFSYENAMLVDPYRLITGLADTVIGLGVRVFEHSKVLTMEPLATGRGTRITTATGTLVADKVLLAMNGYAGGLNPFARSVMPIRAHVLATEPLTGEQLAQLEWNGRGGIIDQRTFFNYYRMTADDRLVFGGGPVTVPTADPVADSRSADAIQQRLRTEMTARFPVLTDVAVTARWSAVAASTPDRLPIVGEIPGLSGVYHAGAWCGHGLALAVDSAWRFGLMFAGQPIEMLPWWRRGALGMPRKVLDVGTRTYLKLLDLADRYDMRETAEAAGPRIEQQAQRLRKVAS
jgi:glycine/D-amino acid oxidase-like deaminating enzyme